MSPPPSRLVSGSVIEMLEAFEAKEGRDTKPLFEICEDTISKGAFVRATLPDGTVDRIYGFASDNDAARWIKNEKSYGRQLRRPTHVFFYCDF